MSGLELILIALGFFATLGAVGLYRKLAIRYGILATTNSRTLHEKIVPRGGGLAVGLVFSLCCAVYWGAGMLDDRMTLAIAGGGFLATLIGFADDYYQIRALPKLGLHGFLALWLTAVFYASTYGAVLEAVGPIKKVVLLALVIFVPLWLINLFNFIDGIDGLAISASVLASIGAMLVLAISGGPHELIVLFLLLTAGSIAFFVFNCPPASIFLGDSGSIFLGYVFSALILATVFTGQIRAATWVALLAYYIADTSTTTAFRVALVHRWYGVHRSHAYQNLARTLKAHAPVTAGIAAYQILWAIPLAVWSAMKPQWGWIAALAAVLPAVLWTVKFGPRFSRD